MYCVRMVSLMAVQTAFEVFKITKLQNCEGANMSSQRKYASYKAAQCDIILTF